MTPRILYISLPHIRPDISVTCSDAQFLMDLKYIYQPYSMFVEEPRACALTCKIIPTGADGCELWINGKCFNFSQTEAYRFICRTLISNFYCEPGFIHLHGCAVAGRDGLAVLFLGHTMAGKSTLASYLSIQPEYRYITDDNIIMNVHQAQVLPFNKPLMLRSESVELLTNEYNISLPPLSTSRDRFFYDVPNALCTKTTIKAIVFLNRQLDRETRLERLDGAKEIASLLASSANKNIASHIGEYAHVVNNIPLYKLHYSSLVHANALIHNL